MASPGGHRSRAPKKLGEHQPPVPQLIPGAGAEEGAALYRLCQARALRGRGWLRAGAAPPGMCFSPGMGPRGSWWGEGGRDAWGSAGCPAPWPGRLRHRSRQHRASLSKTRDLGGRGHCSSGGQRGAEAGGAARWPGCPGHGCGCWLSREHCERGTPSLRAKVGCSDGGREPLRAQQSLCPPSGPARGGGSPSFLTPVGHFPSAEWGKLRHGHWLQRGRAARNALGTARPYPGTARHHHSCSQSRSQPSIPTRLVFQGI